MRKVLAILMILSVCLPFAMGGPVAAQGLGSLFGLGASPSGDAAPESDGVLRQADIDRIIRQARESGLGVVVIDAAGTVTTDMARPPGQPSGSAPADDAPADDAADETARMGPLIHMQENVQRFRTALVKRVLELPVAFNEVLFILRAASPDGSLGTYLKVLLFSMMLLAVGVLFEKEVFGKRWAKRFVVARIAEQPEGYLQKMPFLVYRFLIGVVGILVSMAVAYILGALIFGPLEDTALQFTATLINAAYFFSRLVASIWRMALSPFLPQYRIPSMNTHDAKRLYRWLYVLGSVDICTILFTKWIGELGLNYDVYAFLASLLSAVIVVMNVVMVLVNRKAISGAIRGGAPLHDTSRLTRTLSTVWAPIVIVYVIFAWLEQTYDLVLGKPSAIPLIAGAYCILMSIIVVYGVINYLIERSFTRARTLRRINAARAAAMAAGEADEPDHGDVSVAEPDETAEDDMTPRPALHTFEDLARRVAAILAFVAGAYSFLLIWNSDSPMMTDTFGERVLDILVIVFLGYILYNAFRIWIDSKIREEEGEAVEAEPGDEGGHSSASRLATLLPLFRNFILVLVMVTIVLIVLLEFGINVGPLFAGAGVVGVAVGFGSQALVRDIFSGGFFLFDDAFRKGEYLDVGGVKGTVEKISVRSFQLRHHLGMLHTIPFGEIQVMTNYSRDWVIMKLPLRVTYDTDVEKVRKLIKNLGLQLLEDPEIGGDFIQPLKSQGVIEMQDSAMIIRVKFMTKPGDQWMIRKRVYQDIRALFEKEGIKFAHREVTVRLADGKVDDLTDAERHAITAAAQATEEEMMEDAGPDDNGDDR